MSDLVQVAAASWWSTIAPLSIQATLVFLVVATVDRLLPRRTWPELRSALWTLVIARLLLPPAIGSPWSLLPDNPLASTVTNVVNASEHGSLIAVAIPIVWLLGFITVVAIGARRYAGEVRRSERGESSAAHDGLRAELDSLASMVGLRRAPLLRLTTGDHAPCVVGLMRPEVRVPGALVFALPSERLRHVLVHELAHIARRDIWRATVVALVAALYWFHPLVWITARRLAALREQCCDATVARVYGVDTGAYYRTLLSFAAGRLSPTPARLGLWHSRSALVERLQLLEGATPERPLLRRLATAVILMTVLVVGLPAARAADTATASVVELVTRPPGCLPLRYMVLQRLAERDRGD